MSVSTRDGTIGTIYQCDKPSCGNSALMRTSEGRFEVPRGWVTVQLRGNDKVVIFDCCSPIHAAAMFPKFILKAV